MADVIALRDICEVLVNGKWKRVVWTPTATALMRRHGATDLRYREGYITYNECMNKIAELDAELDDLEHSS